MRHLLVAAAVAVVGCGGTDTGGGGAPPPQAVAPQAGTYKATPTAAAATALSIVPVGPVIGTTFITDGSGAFSMVLPNYDFVRGGMTVKPDGTLSIGTGLVLAHSDGTMSPAQLLGTSNGKTIAGTVGADTFSVTLTTLQDQPFTVTQMAGKYFSTSSSTGLWMAFSLTPHSGDSGGSITGYAYATQADMMTGDTGKAVRNYYEGSISPVTPPVSGGYVVPPNVFDIGFAYHELPAGSSPAGTYGHAYFTAAGLVALTVNPYTGDQLSAVFAKQ